MAHQSVNSPWYSGPVAHGLLHRLDGLRHGRVYQLRLQAQGVPGRTNAGKGRNGGSLSIRQWFVTEIVEDVVGVAALAEFRDPPQALRVRGAERGLVGAEEVAGARRPVARVRRRGNGSRRQLGRLEEVVAVRVTQVQVDEQPSAVRLFPPEGRRPEEGRPAAIGVDAHHQPGDPAVEQGPGPGAGSRSHRSGVRPPDGTFARDPPAASGAIAPTGRHRETASG